VSTYRPTLTDDVELVNPRFLCGCGHEEPVREEAPAWPICPVDGQRMTMVTGDGLPYVGTPGERVEAARAEYEEAYGDWLERLGTLRAYLDDAHAKPGRDSVEWRGRWVTGYWRGLERDGERLAHLAANVDRIECEVGK
jgi:hypothetical protein